MAHMVTHCAASFNQQSSGVDQIDTETFLSMVSGSTMAWQRIADTK
jgi:hypothetical protein